MRCCLRRDLLDDRAGFRGGRVECALHRLGRGLLGLARPCRPPSALASATLSAACCLTSSLSDSCVDGIREFGAGLGDLLADVLGCRRRWRASGRSSVAPRVERLRVLLSVPATASCGTGEWRTRPRACRSARRRLRSRTAPTPTISAASQSGNGPASPRIAAAIRHASPYSANSPAPPNRPAPAPARLPFAVSSSCASRSSSRISREVCSVSCDTRSPVD